jgi:hypothetical protein
MLDLPDGVGTVLIDIDRLLTDAKTVHPEARVQIFERSRAFHQRDCLADLITREEMS